MHRTHVATPTFAVILFLLSTLGFITSVFAQAPANLFQRIPASFEINKGQFTDDVRYVAHTAAYKASIKSSELVLHTEPSKALATKIREKRATELDLQAERPITLSFVGANANAQATAEEASTRRSHYFWGESGATKSVIDVPHYRRVRVANLYQGVDVVYYGAQADMEYDLVVQPGAETSRIKLKFDREATLDKDGNLVIGAGDSKIVHRKPVVYQQDQPTGSNGLAKSAASAPTKRSVASRYAKNADGTFGIALGDYDRKAPLTIDPVISFVTFMGGGRDDELRDAVVDSSGRVMLTGYTSSSNFPIINAPVAPYPMGVGGEAAFVTRLNTAGTDIEFSTVLFNAKPNALQLDGQGNIYVAASARPAYNGALVDLPITVGAYQHGTADIYLFKLSPDGRTLLASTYFGDGGSVARLAVNLTGEVVILGTSSIATTAGVWTAIKPTNSSDFVAKLDSLLRTVTFATYIPATANSVAIDATGNVYVVGQTYDPAFTVTPGVIQSALCGTNDGFVTKLSPAGQVIASTFFGFDARSYAGQACIGNDKVNDVIVAPSGAIYISGATDSIPYLGVTLADTRTPQDNDWNQLLIGDLRLSTGRRAIVQSLNLTAPLTFMAKLSNDLKTISYSGRMLAVSTAPGSSSLQIDAMENVLLTAIGGAGLYAPGSIVSSGQYVMAINAAGMRQYASFVPNGRVRRDPVSGDVYVLSSPLLVAQVAAQPTAGNSAGLGGIEISIIKIRNPLANVTILADKTTLTSGGSLQLSATINNLPSGGTFVFRSSNQEIGRVPATTGLATLTLPNMAAGIQFYSVRYEHPSTPNPVASASLVVTINQPEVCN
jgi:hypothetical protein